MSCPVCKKPKNPEYKPFCSKRCQQVDLGKWFSGRYAVPTEEAPADAPIAPEDDET